MHYNCLNESISCKMSVTPKAGMLGTMFVGSDRYIVVCSEVISPKNVRVLQFLPDHILSQYKTDENGVEYLTDEALEQAIYRATPNLDNLIKKYGEKHGKEIYEFDMKQFKYRTRYSLRKNGRWMPKGESAWGTSSIHWGVGDEYRDPSF